MKDRSRAVGVVAVVLVLVLAVAAGLLWRENRRLTETVELATAQADAVRTASRIAVSMTTYDHRTVDEDFDWIERDGTDGFEETFSESTKPIRQLIERTRATSTGKVSDAAGTAEDADHVEVILFVDQRLTSSGAKPTVDSNRVVMGMVRQGGRWLVDSVDLR